jgi:hypothetical protein
MTRLIQSLLGYNREDASPEEIEAYRVANEALHYRVNAVARQADRNHFANRVTTDAFGRSTH